MTFRSLSLLLVVFLWVHGQVQADVESISGSIIFNAGSLDNRPEMYLTQEGLGIGVAAPSSNLHVGGNAIISNDLSIGGSSSSSANLFLNGTITNRPQFVLNSSTNLNASLSFAEPDIFGSNIQITLPYAGNVAGRVHHIINKSRTYSVFIHGSGNVISDTSSIELGYQQGRYGSVTVVSDGTQWYILQDSGNVGEIASANLLGYWNFDNLPANSLSVLDHSDHSHTLTATAIATNLQVDGVFQKGFTFNGSDNYLTIADPVDGSLDVGTGDFAFSCWIKPVDDGTIQTLISKVDTGHSSPSIAGAVGWDILVRCDTTNIAQLRMADGSGYVQVSGGTNLADGNWHHVLVNMNRDGNVDLYTDGVANSSDASARTATVSNDGPFRLGTRRPADQWFYNGDMDDVRFYNKSLTPEEIATLYNSGR